MGTSIISQRFLSEAACSLYGKEEKNIERQVEMEKRDHFYFCFERAGEFESVSPPGPRVENFAFQLNLDILKIRCPLILL